MHRFYLPPEQTKVRPFVLTGGEAHHAIQVLRLRRGDEGAILNGAGGEFLCSVSEVAKSTVSMDVISEKQHPPRLCEIALLQAIPKGKLIESIIQKATELGAAEIVPLVTDRVVTHLDSDAGGRKATKWRQAAIEAMKQCGTPWLPTVTEPITPREFLALDRKFDLPFVGALLGETRHPAEWFNEFRKQHQKQPQSICFWVGPEGDFTPDELDLIKKSGAKPITLGPLVLRTETAAIFCLSLAAYELSKK
jgi:16S rRNA (uracil1498-N3)-methyltransferase